MSQTYNAADAGEIKEIAIGMIEIYTLLAITIMLPFYEFVITFDQEVAAVWTRKQKLSFGSVLLVSTRWCMVLLAILDCIPPTITSCKPQLVVGECLALAGFAQVAVFSAIRVSAIWGRSWLLFSVILVLGLAPVATNAYQAAHSTHHFVEESCITAVGLSPKTEDMLVLMTRVPVIVADVLVLVLTWVKTYSQVMNARKAGQTMSVSLCLLRDGTAYFAILLVFNILELVVHGTLEVFILSGFITTIPPILVSRFMLNLRQIDNKNSTQTIGRFSNFSAPQFRAADSIFGNFGEPLEHGASLLGEGEGEQERDAVDGSASWVGTSELQLEMTEGDPPQGGLTGAV